MCLFAALACSGAEPRSRAPEPPPTPGGDRTEPPPGVEPREDDAPEDAGTPADAGAPLAPGDEATPADDAGTRADDDAGAHLETSGDTVTQAETREPPLGRSCSNETWGGWEGTPACRRAARRTVRGVHRGCRTDADCVLLGSSCEKHAVSTRFRRRYERWPSPCTPPGAGQCAGPSRAVCSHGCCYPDMGLGM